MKPPNPRGFLLSFSSNLPSICRYPGGEGGVCVGGVNKFADLITMYEGMPRARIVRLLAVASLNPCIIGYLALYKVPVLEDKPSR